MSHSGYNQMKSGTPEKWIDSGTILRGSVDGADGYSNKLCGLTQVDSIVESGTGVLTLNLAQLVNVLSVTATGVDPAVSNLTCTVANVNAAGTNNGGNTSTQIVLQVYQAGSKGALTLNQGLCVSIEFSKSSLLIGSAAQAGMVAVL